jgi:hypothetical protein
MQEELTVRVEHPELPAIRWNETEVQQNLTEMLAAYTGRVYTPDTIKDAKADRAAVNKLDKQLSDAARSAKAFYMKPLEEFLQSTKQMQTRCRGAFGAGQDAGGHSVDDGRFGSFTVSLLKIHFVFPFLLCTSTIYNPDFTMRRWKTKYGYFLSNGADFFCAIFC